MMKTVKPLTGKLATPKKLICRIHGMSLHYGKGETGNLSGPLHLPAERRRAFNGSSYGNRLLERSDMPVYSINKIAANLRALHSKCHD